MSVEQLGSASIDSSDIPSVEKWEIFLDNYIQHRSILLDVNSDTSRLIIENNTGKVFETPDSYIIKLEDTMLLSSKSAERLNRSKRFTELFPDKNYNGEKYAIVANGQEINIYNLYTNNLIASVVSAFCFPPTEISKKKGLFEFQVIKNIFDEGVK
jgi:hypothetical protein